MAVAEKQQQRLEERFKMWDNDGDGRVEREDFEAEARGILTNFGEPESSPKGRAVMDAYLQFWDSLAKAGGGGAGGFTFEKFSEVVNQQVLSQGDKGYDQSARPMIKAIADLCDQDGDGEVNPEEWKKWMAAVGVDQTRAAETFRQLDTSGNGALSTDELVNAVRDFHLGKLDVELLGS